MKPDYILQRNTIKDLKQAAEKAETDWSYISGISGDGPIEEFENEVRKITGGGFALGVTNCTSAIMTALLASNVGSGDEVILPSLTWGQTLAPVLFCGATPVFADVKKNSVTIDLNSIKKLISNKTKAILAVHLYGVLCDVESLAKFCKAKKILLIFDSAQYFNKGSKKIGKYGDFIAFSFGRGKNVTSGEGGVLICNRRSNYEKAVLVSQHPLRAHKLIDNNNLREKVDSVCLNFRMNPLSAVIGLSEMRNLENNNNINSQNYRAKIIRNLKRKIGGINIISKSPTIVVKIKRQTIKNVLSILEKHCYDYRIETPNLLHKSNTIKNGIFWGRKLKAKSSCNNSETLSNYYIIIITGKK